MEILPDDVHSSFYLTMKESTESVNIGRGDTASYFNVTHLAHAACHGMHQSTIPYCIYVLYVSVNYISIILYVTYTMYFPVYLHIPLYICIPCTFPIHQYCPYTSVCPLYIPNTSVHLPYIHMPPICLYTPDMSICPHPSIHPQASVPSQVHTPHISVHHYLLAV